jgi:hypothetical protein
VDLTGDVMTRNIRRGGTRCVCGGLLFSVETSCLIVEINTQRHSLEGLHSVWRCWGRHLQCSAVHCSTEAVKGYGEVVERKRRRCRWRRSRSRSRSSCKGSVVQRTGSEKEVVQRKR